MHENEEEAGHQGLAALGSQPWRVKTAPEGWVWGTGLSIHPRVVTGLEEDRQLR